MSEDVGTYLARIDWLGAAVLATAAVALALVAIRAAEHLADRLPEMRGEMGWRLAHRGFSLGRGVPSDRWVCSRCRSWNDPAASACYRGCGPRDRVEGTAPDATADLGRQTGGRGTRKG